MFGKKDILNVKLVIVSKNCQNGDFYNIMFIYLIGYIKSIFNVPSILVYSIEP